MNVIKINKENQNKKLKDFIFEKFQDNFSLSKISKSIKNGDIKVNQKKVSWDYLLKENDEVKIYLKIKDCVVSYDFLKAASQLNVIYEDENIIAVNKPRGLVCQKDKNEKFDTLNNRIKKYLYEKDDNSFNNVHLVHRLDKYTTGICIAGKTKEVIKNLNDVWNTNAVNKYYRCLVLGKVKQKNKTLKDYIMLNEEKQIMQIDKNNLYNKQIITHYKLIHQYQNYAELEVKIDTGKKHQIRVHLASDNHPILGDNKYNKLNLMNYKYPCLVSYKIVFNFNKHNSLNYLNKILLTLKKYNYK